MDLFSSLPSKNSSINSYILGILVDPPTKTISYISDLLISASINTFTNGGIQLSNNFEHSSSNLSLVIFITKSSDSANYSISMVV